MVDTKNITRLAKRVKDIRVACQNDFGKSFRYKNLDRRKDIRATSIIRLTRLLIGINVSFLYIINTDQEKALNEIKIMFYEESMPIEQFLLSNEVFLKLGYTSSLFFILEGVLKIYLQHLDIQSYKRTKGIKNICEELLEKLNCKDSVFYSSVFNFLRLIRNTLHSNGIHIPANKSDKNISPIIYKGKSYIFEENKRIDFVTWDLLLDLTEDMKNLLFLLANDETINKSKELIHDPLAI